MPFKSLLAMRLPVLCISTMNQSCPSSVLFWNAIPLEDEKRKNVILNGEEEWNIINQGTLGKINTLN